MRYILLIPALFLFLSNIPFIHKMDMKEAMAKMKKDGCCKKADSRKGSCRMSDENASCSRPPVQKEEPCKKTEGSCAKQAESTCVCICCFQFAAPAPIGTNLQFQCNSLEKALSSYLLQHWKDPQLAVPWQPPDV
ncbi:MAG: hypothetical protein WCF67_12840 [Chitinophagaceae bacterium]